MMRSMRFTDYRAAKQEMRDLIPLHYAELGDSDLYKLRPNDEVYDAMAEQEHLLMILAFYGPKCIGYAFTFLSPATLHDKGAAVAQNDLLYVHPDHRNGHAGKELMDYTRDWCKRLGYSAVIWTAKDGTPLDRILKKRMPLLEHTYIDKLT